MQPADDGVPLAAFIVRMVGFVVDDEQLPRAAGDALGEIDLLYLLGRRPRAQNGRHHIRLILLRAIWPFVKLLDIGQE